MSTQPVVQIDEELKALYRRRAALERVITSLKYYQRQCEVTSHSRIPTVERLLRRMAS